ncbi:Cfh [Phodopus roborovskii]|uniref:Complement factor H n=1 Tax=Phodopus roborovskii TaxID=109678 RepID=A0AAU9Z6L9_PHORO|nr:Cfh [Phodopus roborovskii]
MRLSARLIWLILWTVCVAEDCKGPPPKENTEILSGSWPDQPYPEGTQATYKCRPGYRTLGSITKICRRGEWVASNPSRICQKRPCGHPGDTPFGSFRLAIGTGFEFGAKVVYTCNEGYRLLGEIDYRECDSDGWTNTVPLCEAAKCLPVTEPENGRIVSSAAEPDQEYYFGQVVRFACNAGFKVEGQKEIHCSENGLWSHEKPRCVEISCTPPEVKNGQAISKKPVYKENERYQYKCNRGFEFKERGDALCTASGWSPQPSCEEMTCKPPYIPNGVYTPHRIKHRAGDDIRYTCTSGFHPATRETVVTCTSTGWIPAPRCSLKPCDFPQIKTGGLYYEERYRPYFPAAIGKYFSYFCNSGYVTPSGSYWDYIRCTTQGWEPAVPCLRVCSFPYVDHGALLERKASYVQDQSVRIQCYPGYGLPNGQDTITCTENGWSPQPKCIRVRTDCDSLPRFENAILTEEKKASYRSGEQVTFKCAPSYQMNGSNIVTCVNRTWIGELVCKDTSCGDPPHVENATIVTRPMAKYPTNERVRYECNKPFELFGEEEVMCQNGIWTEPPKCKDSTGKCGPPPPINNGDITSFPLSVYAPLSSVEYQCQSLYQLQGNKEITCTNGEWSAPPKCLHACVISEDIMKRHNITLRWMENQKLYSQSGDYVEFTCISGYKQTNPSPPFRTMCIDGHINYPSCSKKHYWYDG